MRFNIYDSEGEKDYNKWYRYEMTKDKFFIDGSYFGNPDRCYTPFFRHMKENTDPPRDA